MDESRKQFEEWFNPRKIAMQKRGISTIRIVRLHKKMLEAWQSSRAAVEIELPPAVDGSNVPFAGNAWNAYRVEAVEAIRAAGIKVKE